MDESEAEVAEQENMGAATPIFSVYRRGYDPEQVDRYVTDQQRRLDEAVHRASESERKLAAAVGQLRELHRRVAVYESEARTAQPPALDTLGERVQRILQEAWEGAYNLRQDAEKEVNELRDQAVREVAELRAKAERDAASQREQAAKDVEELRQVASKEAADLVDDATSRALALRDEMDRRRQAYLERVERDRQEAVSQISFLYDQRQLAISELARLQATVQATIEEMVHSPLGKPLAEIADSVTAPEDQTSEEVEAFAGADGIEAGEVSDMAELAVPELDFPDRDEGDAEQATVDTGGLFDQIIDDPDRPDAADDLETGPEVAPPWESGADPTIAGLNPTLEGAADIPTGPMDSLGYGYRAQSEPISDVADETGDIADDDGMPVIEEPRQYGGVYDAEADGWA